MLNHGLFKNGDWNAPNNVRNSPIKPLRPGNPTEASIAITKKTANFGITLVIPPNSDISLVWRLSYNAPTHKNNIPVDNP